MSKAARAGAVSLGMHDHACQVDSTAEELVAGAAGFLAAGLERGNLCWHVRGADELAPAIREALARTGVDVPAAEERGALAFVAPEAFQLRLAAFDPDEMLGFASALVADSRARGFSGLSFVADMTWTLLGFPGTERFLEAESRLSGFSTGHDVAALCQFHRPRFRPEVVRDAIHTHPLVVSGGTVHLNPHFVPPDEFLSTPDPAAEVDRLLASLRGAAVHGHPGLVTICAWCKGIREDEVWSRVEEWAARKMGLTFTHALCPDCFARLGPPRE
jgi:MEDS: MEthanogen/methylotroph, DcmR Sensory domain